MARVKSALRPGVGGAARDTERENTLCQRVGIALPGAGAVRQVRSEPRIMPMFPRRGKDLASNISGLGQNWPDLPGLVRSWLASSSWRRPGSGVFGRWIPASAGMTTREDDD